MSREIGNLAASWTPYKLPLPKPPTPPRCVHLLLPQGQHMVSCEPGEDRQSPLGGTTDVQAETSQVDWQGLVTLQTLCPYWLGIFGDRVGTPITKTTRDWLAIGTGG